MKEHGLCSTYQEYLDLPLGVLEDARLLAEGEELRFERTKPGRGTPNRPRRR